MVSQLLSAVLDNRPLLRSLPQWAEYFWLIGWTSLGGILIFFIPKKRLRIIILLIVIGSIYGICYLLLIQGFILPLVPPVLALVMAEILGLAVVQNKLPEQP